MFVEGLRLRSDIPTRILVTYLPHLRPILPMTVRNNVAFVPHYVPFEQLVHVSDQELFWQNPEINTLSRYGNIQIAKSLLGYIHAK